MAKKICLCLSVVLLCVAIEKESPAQFVIWNVGQGQWVTVKDSSGCWHFDSGGEIAPWKQILELCRNHENFLMYSHWDWDHVSFAKLVRRKLPNSCLLEAPGGHSSRRKESLFANWPHCEIKKQFSLWENTFARTSNGKSRVVKWKEIMIPGDSTSHEEKVWLNQFTQLNEVKYLVLGHHGSQTSTSPRLLEKMRSLKLAIASARHSRYGHPHPKVVNLLSKNRIPLLSTESWGNIRIWL